MNHKRWWVHWALVFLLHAAWSGTTLAQLPGTIERIKPAVVLVGTYRATDAPRFRYVGTGFVVGDGLRVVTNAHVMAAIPAMGADGPSLVVQLRAGAGVWTMRQARVLETVPEHDLALLQIDGPAAAALNVVASDPVREGEELAFMGFPIGGVLGFSSVTHRATVSSITTMALPSPTGQQLSERAIRSLRSGPKRIGREKFRGVTVLSSPEEIAAAVAFLASDDASFVNAATFLVDGGISGAYVTPV